MASPMSSISAQLTRPPPQQTKLKQNEWWWNWHYVSVKSKVFENEGCQKNLKTSTSGCDMLEFVNSKDSHTNSATTFQAFQLQRLLTHAPMQPSTILSSWSKITIHVSWLKDCYPKGSQDTWWSTIFVGKQTLRW